MASIIIRDPINSENLVAVTDVGELAIAVSNADENATVYLAKAQAIELRDALNSIIAKL
jgi:hypothetical protein